ncbi:MAG: DEAD/DEAH box helicase family protein [Bacteriovoracaceae bacterium]|jgi:hypothetical protein|nr:DEAD/DEAH box helicase family protein [Bacteriovoracaceae bacterium]
MKFTLKDYQEEAVQNVLENLKKASLRWHEDKDIHAFSLAATTGAGKTVMAAAVFEALFYGEDNYDFEPDSGAVVVWFSDDPSLNEQTRFRLMEASDRLDHSDLVVVQSNFCEEQLSPGKVYFLNTQKLGKKSLLVRGHEEYGSQTNMFKTVRPDLRANTIWDTITNTIEDPNLTLYLVLDEAHRGMGRNTARDKKDKTTIVKKLINGFGTVPAIPVVLGISATVDRFNVAMEDAQSEGRSLLPNVEVDSKKVQESGLLKDNIMLEIPENVGSFDSVLLSRAVDKIKEISQLWEEYDRIQDSNKPVKPLLVFQVPNTPDEEDIGKSIDLILQNWADIDIGAIAHVFGERASIRFGNYEIPHISPERVQESSHIRVLIAKDAISTGWDCPRAEVMVSFRPAQDKTHITQLMGRMVRTPLARRISGNEKLNSVSCLLPFFDTKTVNDVAKKLMEGAHDGEGRIEGRKILIDSIELIPNDSVSKNVWQKFLELPSQTLPKRSTKPIKRLTALAHELSSDGLLEDAGKLAHSELHKVLDAAQVRYSDKIEESRSKVLNVEGLSLKLNMETGEKTFNDFVEEADFRVIDNAFRRAGRLFSSDLAKTYSEYLAEKNSNNEIDEDSLIDAYVEVAALSLCEDVIEYVEHEANKLSREWFSKYRVDIRGLNDERRDVYNEILAWSRLPHDVDLIKPTSWMVATTILNENDEKEPIPEFEKHLMVNPANKLFPFKVGSSWEEKVLEVELGRKDVLYWYRNPSHQGLDSLGIPYEIDSKPAMVRPDFIFFSKGKNGEIAVDIVDPHGIHFEDALPKLDGLVAYAKQYKNTYRRIESIAKVGGKFRVLDLMNDSVCEAILKSENPEELFMSDVAFDYE